LTRVASDEASATFQQAVVRQFPNVSIIDLALVLRTLDDLLSKIGFVIRFMAAFSIELNEVLIYKLEEGIFFAQLVCQSGDDVLEIDARTSDALALAVRASCPIFTYENILETAGLYLDQGEGGSEPVSAEPKSGTKVSSGNTDKDLKNMSLEDLNTLLQQVLEQEDYVRAIPIRDEINSRQSK
jgi:bifunctional DNase/RNase